MASDDIYLRRDVYAANQRALIAENRLGNNEVLKALDQFKAEVNDRFNKIDSRFTAVDGKFGMVDARFVMVDSRFDKLESQLTSLIGRIDGIERRIESLGNLTMAGIGFVSMLIGLLVFVMPISCFMRRFWKPKPEITIEQIEALIDAKLSAR